ncbi:hypothetical protein ACQ4M4_13270 [Leptolyngbya sp. AN02str]|uniref:hypothetical protein n=1 Tax=Leptolyngbya sp. AN02str TaxID=3423363 RepID=UPI003D30F070
MQIPASFFGTYKETRATCRKLAKQLMKGQAWQEIIANESMVDTSEKAGMLVLAGSPGANADPWGPQFYCYLCFEEALQLYTEEKISFEVSYSVFEFSLQTCWGVLSLLSPQNKMWFYPFKRLSREERDNQGFRPMLFACLQHWDTLYNEGKRYSTGGPHTQDLWQTNTSLKFILANMGVSKELLKGPYPENGIKPIITSVLEN